MTKSRRHEGHDAGVGYRRRPRLGRLILVLTLLLLVVVFSAPIVISRTNLRHRVVPMLLPHLAGTANIGQAQLSWLSPARLDDISILDADGKLLFEAASVSSTKTLGQMALGYTELGMFQINQPHVHLVLHESGTNFDAFLASLEEDDNGDDEDDDSNSDNVAFGIEIIDGTIDIRDVATGETCQLSEVSLRLQSPKPTAGPLAVQLAAKAIHQAQPGTLAADFTWNQPTQLSPHDLGNGELQLETRGLPMAALLPIYRRGDLDLSTQGELTGNVNCQWNQGANGPELLADGALTVAGAVVRMPSILGQDMLQSPVLSVSLDGAIQNEELQINKMDTESDYGQLRMRGHIPLAELFASDFAETLATWKSRHRLHTEGQLDLRKLTESLPQTMRLRDDTALVGGTVTLALDSDPTGPEARQIHGGITTADIVATTGGKTVSWTQPMEIQFAVDSRPAGFEVERFNCSSGFFQASAAGTLAAGSFDASGDFDRLATQLAQFCDLGASQLAGRFHGSGSWSTDADQSYEASAEFTVEDFHLMVDELPPWQEKQLVVAAKALGRADGASISRIDAMQATIESGQDFFSAELTAPVSEISTETTWPVDCKLRGQVSTWLTRMRPWVSTGEWQMSGGIAATANGTVSPNGAFLQPCTVELSDLKAASSSNLIAEPTVKANGTLEWDGLDRRVSLPTLEVVSSALALRARDVNISTAANRIDASGDAAFRGNLARLFSWLQKPTEPATQDLRGNLEGSLSMTSQEGVITFQSKANCAEFSLLKRKTINTATLGPQTAWSEVWREARLQLEAQGEYNSADSMLQFGQFVVTGDAAQVQARGAIRKIQDDPIADLVGEIDYDLAGLVAKLRDLVGPTVQLKGRHRQPFKVRGPLTLNSLQLESQSPPAMTTAAMTTAAMMSVPTAASQPVVHPNLSAEAVFGWDSASVYGVPFGPQQVSMMLQNGTISTSPIETRVSNGTVSVAPRLELAAQPALLVLDQNTKAQNIQITPQMCDDWIKYVAPLLAGTATADGSLSIGISGARIPLAAPALAEASGVVVIENAHVQPGPMAQQLLGVFREATALAKANTPSLSFLEEGNNWLEIQQQQVEFQMTQGRVYHRNLSMSLGNVAVQTSGWVGTDQSMSVVAQIPVSEDWIKDEPLLAGLRGQMIQIPIHGTLSRPQLDRRAFAQLSQQIIGSTAERFLHGELEKGLKKLLGPK